VTRRTTALCRDSACLFCTLALLPAVTTVVRLIAPGAFPATRLALSYPPPTGRLTEAGEILLANCRVAALVIGASVLAATVPATTRSLTGLLIAIAGLNLTIVSVAIASDGARATAALLPHAPVELLGFSLAGAGFLDARRNGRATHPRTIAKAAAAALVLLAAAAVLEVTPT
jgi:hypothetical protein